MTWECSQECGSHCFKVRGTARVDEQSHANYEADIYLDEEGGIDETDIDWDTQGCPETDETDVHDERWDACDVVCSECGAVAINTDDALPIPPKKKEVFVDEEGNEYV